MKKPRTVGAPRVPRRGSTSRKRVPPSTGYLLSLAVQNVRCFASELQTLRFTDGSGRPARWTVLLGNNGTGKTTLLQAIAALTLEPRPFQGEYHLPSIVGSTWPLRTRWRASRLPVGPVRLSLQVCQHQQRFSGIHPARPEVVDVTMWRGQQSTFTWTRAPGLACFGYGPSRRLSSPSVLEKDTSDPCASLFADDAELRSAEDWLLQLDYSASKPSVIQSRLRARIRRVKKLLCDLLPEVTDVRIARPVRRKPTPHAEFRTPYGWVPLQGLGHGYQALIAWVVDFAARMFELYRDRTNPLAGPAILLIDEIDLHLHPSWQRSVMTYLTKQFPNTQFVATAHSPLIVQAAVDANVVLLRREHDHVIIENNPKIVRNWRVDQILTSDLYDLPTARPPAIEDKLMRRHALLSKPRLTKKDRAELARLKADIGDLPIGETSDEADRLKKVVDRTEMLLRKYGARR